MSEAIWGEENPPIREDAANAALQQRQWAFLRGDGVTEMTGFRSANVETSKNDLSYAT
jgi:hypothetical protein